ncbi:MAG: BACON domain-containing protein [Candidatus Cryptobacteroides sp.]
MRQSIQSIFISITLAAALAGCSKVGGDPFDFIELGVTDKVVELPSRTVWTDGQMTDSLSRYVTIYSNQKCILSYDGPEVGWMKLTDGVRNTALKQIVFDGDCTFKLTCTQNDDYVRAVKLVVRTSGGERTDTILVRQLGKRYPQINPASGTLILKGSTDDTGSVALETNIDDIGNIAVDVKYPQEESTSWVKKVTVGKEEITVEASANPSAGDLRFATVTLSYTDGEGTVYPKDLFLIQKTSSDGLGESKSFADVRAVGVAGKDVEITDNILVEGFVVSSLDSGNVGEIVKTSSEAADYESYKTNVYFESLDGQYGFLIKTETASDNIFSRYDRVTFLLRGATIRREDDPERYVISGITTANIITHNAATKGDIPVKEKFADELADEDMYTYVTLKDCEFGVRKGSLTPVNEGYTLGKNKGHLVSYPRLVRDSRGSSIYMYTNTTCPYRRDGVRLPYGSGKLSGVIVYELYPGYVYGDGVTDDLSGNIGRYQIRHQSYDDIEFDMESGFSSTLVEYCYTSGFKTDGKIYWFEPTDGSRNGRFYHSTGTKPVKPLSTFNYIGWVGTSSGVAPFKNHIGLDASLAEPLGYSFADGIAFDYTNTNADGAGKVGMVGSTEIMDGWRCTSWWDDANDLPYYWVIELSTTGISASHISLIFTAYGGETSAVAKSPYYWKVQWSQNGENDWTDVEEYVVPDGVVNGTYKEWQLPAMKQYDIPLPLDILGKDKVYIRLVPKNKITNSVYFNEAELKDGKDASNALDYFAIRYN